MISHHKETNLNSPSPQTPPNTLAFHTNQPHSKQLRQPVTPNHHRIRRSSYSYQSLLSFEPIDNSTAQEQQPAPSQEQSTPKSSLSTSNLTNRFKQKLSSYRHIMGQQLSQLDSRRSSSVNTTNDSSFPPDDNQRHHHHHHHRNNIDVSTQDPSFPLSYSASIRRHLSVPTLNQDEMSQVKAENSTTSADYHDEEMLPADSADSGLALQPITSPLDNPHPYPSTFYLSPITSNESRYSNESYDEYRHPHNEDYIVDESPSSSVGTLPPKTESIDDVIMQDEEVPVEKVIGESEEQFSPLLSLPLEILYRIIEYVYVDHDISSINSNLENFANTIPLLSKKFHHLSLCFLYKYTIFNRPHSFDKFLHNLNSNPIIGKYVEFMDFQQFTSIGLGRTGRMNQEIQMVTSKTISKALKMTPNLLEFLASENIQDDMDIVVLDLLFNKLPKIKALDFCGASSEAFAKAFDALQINQDLTITKLSLHDCSNLHPDVFAKILPRLIHLQRLDLNHTSITSTILLEIPRSTRLTHLSLARCSQLTTKDLINFLVSHPAVCKGSLEWLNLQIDSNVVSPLSDIYLLYTLKHLNAPQLAYLNLGGMPVNFKCLITIKNRFPELLSLNISHANLKLEDLNEYMKENKIMYLDITGIKTITRFNLPSFLKINFNSSLVAVEFDYKILYDFTSNGDYNRISPIQTSYIEELAPPQIWIKISLLPASRTYIF
ncbi:uncharacterized protein J8A68_001870 [[Candida] subhashii]|uniref:Uncharacterized protein n=1 Tax=[Candida] subhashii TaxID=561895 RepID=A0A8J5UQ81_9ASCO|nr:uncharacterized protein J8A68_001870 [[Candida] subhashii]KAG7664576.1 hypothetical protein J8A68_001870 [[Candida] subhashii]